MYSSARSSPSLSGSGTAEVTSVTIAGFVPQVTWGETWAASITSSSSNSRRPRCTARATRPRGAKSSGAPGRPSTHSKVVSSGAIMPARPPPSIVMLHTVMRPSIESASIGGPAYSIT